MNIVASIFFILAAIVLLMVLKNFRLFGGIPDMFQWHRASGRDAFYIRIISKVKIITTLTIYVDDKLTSIKVHDIRPHCYDLYVPPGTTLNQLHSYVISHMGHDEIILALFGCIKTRKALDDIFTEKQDKESCIEMFGYLKESLLYR